MFGIALEITVRLEPIPPGVRTLLADFPTVRARQRGRHRDHRLRQSFPPALEMMDQSCVRAVEASIYAAGYPTDAAAVLLVEVDGLARDGRRGGARWWRRCSGRTARARSGSAATAGRPGPPLAGTKEGLRRHGAHRAGPGGAGRRRARAPRCPTSSTGSRPSATRHGLHGQQRLPRRRRQPAPQYQLRPPGSGPEPSGPARPAREIMQACSAPAAAITGEHGVGNRQARVHGRDVRRRDPRRRCAPSRRAFDPGGARQPRQGGSRCTPAGNGSRHDGRRTHERGDVPPAAPAARRRGGRAGPRGPAARRSPIDEARGRGLPPGTGGGMEDPDRRPRQLDAARRPGGLRADDQRARPGRLGEPGGPRRDRPGRGPDRRDPSPLRRPRHVARRRSAGTPGPHHRLGRGHRRPPARSGWLRPGPRSRPRLHRRHRRRPGDPGGRTGGEERRRLST